MTSGKKRTYGAVIGFCAVALLVDRVFLTDSVSGPARAEASQTAALPVDAAAATADRRPIPRVAFPSVGEDTERRPPRDFFARLDPQPSEVPPAAATGADGGDQLLRGVFEDAAKLDGVMLADDVAIAVVNGARMVRGDALFGCRLTNIFGRSVRFQCSDGQAVLFIAPQGLQTGN